MMDMLPLRVGDKLRVGIARGQTHCLEPGEPPPGHIRKNLYWM